VPSIEAARTEFGALGWEVCGPMTDDQLRKVRIQFMRMGDEVVELVAPLTEDSPIRKNLQRGSGMPYHICYEVDSLGEAEAELKALHFIVFKKPQAAPAIGGRLVEWFYSKNNGIIELVEKRK
jgi:methylmalonyl-CoA/ethylmalonyl-CoA epimerase